MHILALLDQDGFSAKINKRIHQSNSQSVKPTLHFRKFAHDTSDETGYCATRDLRAEERSGKNEGKKRFLFLLF